MEEIAFRRSVEVDKMLKFFTKLWPLQKSKLFYRPVRKKCSYYYGIAIIVKKTQGNTSYVQS